MKRIIFIFMLMTIFPLMTAEQTVKTVEFPIGYVFQTSPDTNYVTEISVSSPDNIAEILSLEILLNGDFQASTGIKAKAKVGGSLQDCSPATWTTPSMNAPSYDVAFDCTNLVKQYNWKGGTEEFGFRTDKAAQNIYGTLKMTYYNNPKGSVSVMGTEYVPGDIATIFLQLKDNQNLPENDGACYIDVYSPLFNSTHSIYLSDAPMIYLNGSDGIYYYDISSLNSDTGVYILSASCSYTHSGGFVYPPSELVYSPTRNVEIGTYSGSSILLNDYADGLYTHCDSGGGSIKICQANYTFDTTIHFGNLSQQNITNIDFYYMGEASVSAFGNFSVWSYTENKWVNLPNKLTFSGHSTSEPHGISDFVSNSFPGNLSRFISNGLIKVKTEISFGSSFMLHNNWLNLKINTETGSVQNVKGSGEIHVSSALEQLNQSIEGIADEVWNYNGNVSSNLLSQFASNIWSYTGSISSTILDFVSENVWNYNNRNLTYYPEVNTTAIVVDVWNYNNRNLTYYETISVNETQIAESVWSYVNRTLTESSASGGLTTEQNQTLYDILDLLGSVNETVSSIQTTQSAIAGALEVVHSTVSEYGKGENGSSVVLVKLNGVPISGATVTGDYYYPNQSEWIKGASFSEVGTTGVYYYNFDIPSEIPNGVYKVKIKGEKATTGSSSFDNFDDGNTDGWSFTGATWNASDEGDPQNYVLRKWDYGGFIFGYSDSFGVQTNFRYDSKVRSDGYQGYVGVTFRYIDSGNNYIAYIRQGADNIRLMKHTNGGASTLYETGAGSLVTNDGQWYNFTVIATGGNFKIYVDDVLYIDYTDIGAVHESGKVGAFAYNSVGSWDDMNVTAYGTSNEAYSIIDFKISEPSATTINNTAIAEAVWNYNGTFSNNILSTFATSIWEYSGTASKGITKSISEAISKLSGNGGKNSFQIIRISGTEYNINDTAKIIVQVLMQGIPNNDAFCKVDIYSPNETSPDEYVKTVSQANLTYINGSNGMYYYNFNQTEQTGLYVSDAVCMDDRIGHIPLNYSNNLTATTSSTTQTSINGSQLSFNSSVVSPVFAIMSVQMKATAGSGNVWTQLRVHNDTVQQESYLPANEERILLMAEIFDEFQTGNYTIEAYHNVTSGITLESKVNILGFPLNDGIDAISFCHNEPGEEGLYSQNVSATDFVKMNGTTCRINLTREAEIFIIGAFNVKSDTPGSTVTIVAEVDGAEEQEKTRSFTGANQYGSVALLTVPGTTLSAGEHELYVKWKTDSGTITAKNVHFMAISSQAANRLFDLNTETLASDSTTSSVFTQLGEVGVRVDEPSYMAGFATLSATTGASNKVGSFVLSFLGNDGTIFDRYFPSADKAGSIALVEAVQIPERGYNDAILKWHSEGNTLTATNLDLIGMGFTTKTDYSPAYTGLDFHVTDNFQNLNVTLSNISVNLDGVANEVWNYSGTIVSNILNAFSDNIWTRTDRNLTYYAEPNTTAIVVEVWNATGRYTHGELI